MITRIANEEIASKVFPNHAALMQPMYDTPNKNKAISVRVLVEILLNFILLYWPMRKWVLNFNRGPRSRVIWCKEFDCSYIEHAKSNHYYYFKPMRELVHNDSEGVRVSLG